jgi:dipeptidyl aminopeptidase/acylaminoacyl peptidase
MVDEIQPDDTWKQRFRAPVVLYTQLAQENPARGLAVSNRSGIYQLYAWKVATGELTQLTDGPEARVFGAIAPDGRYVYYLADQQGNEIGHWVRLPFEGGEPEDMTPDLPNYASWSWDFGRAGTIGGFVAADDEGFHLYVIELHTGGGTSVANPPGPRMLYHTAKLIVGPYLSHGGEIAVIGTTERTGKPALSLVAFDVSSGERRAVPASASWQSVSFHSSDGQAIQAWLAVPRGRDGPFPTVLETHGGPEAVTTEVFSPRAQTWLDHGFAYLTVNYHGSTTFGRAFQASIWGRPGDLEVEDMTAAHTWLVEHGIARRDEIFATGWSYGGYLTLQALGTRPELWAGGMAGVAIADWTMEYEDEAETLRGYDVALFGGTPEDKPDAYTRGSPLTYVENVRAPVLIIQGRNDTRCPPRQVEVYEEKMKELGTPIEVVWFDAGHIGGRVEQDIEHMEIMLNFVQRVRQGRAELSS